MKNGNDYRIIVEKKYNVVFTDGQGKEQNVEVLKEVAEAIQYEQRKECALHRATERYCVSLDKMDYEGRNSYQFMVCLICSLSLCNTDPQQPKIHKIGVFCISIMITIK